MYRCTRECEHGYNRFEACSRWNEQCAKRCEQRSHRKEACSRSCEQCSVSNEQRSQWCEHRYNTNERCTKPCACSLTNQGGKEGNRKTSWPGCTLFTSRWPSAWASYKFSDMMFDLFFRRWARISLGLVFGVVGYLQPLVQADVESFN